MNSEIKKQDHFARILDNLFEFMQARESSTYVQ